MASEKEVREVLDTILDKQRAFQNVFNGPSGAIVLKEFMKFCRVTSPPWGSTPEHTARYVGRNEVWHHIMRYLKYSPAELLELFTEGKVRVIRHKEEDEE